MQPKTHWPRAWLRVRVKLMPLGTDRKRRPPAPSIGLIVDADGAIEEPAILRRVVEQLHGGVVLVPLITHDRLHDAVISGLRLAGDLRALAELALNDRQRMTGMMFRTNMAESEAMLFVFPVPHRTAFYMKNTTVPLSAAYIDPDGTILEIHDLKPLEEKPVEASSDKIQFVLEVNQSWFERNKVGTGTVIRTEHGSLAETFFERR